MIEKLILFSPTEKALTETFISNHIRYLPYEVVPIFGVRWGVKDQLGIKIFPLMFWLGRFLEKTFPAIDNALFNYLLARYLARSGASYILAEYGTTGAWVVQAAVKIGIPIFTIFHGFDASDFRTLEQNKEGYKRLFRYASGIVAVSKKMRDDLIAMGADAETTICSPCGADPDLFAGSDVFNSDPILFGVGRFVEKKAPHLTILAFKQVLNECPGAQLRLGGSGPLWGPCKRLIEALDLSGSVTLLGQCSAQQVATEMRRARAFVQHSLRAENGDSEGAPVAIIEAQMCGLPVIATHHAGIPDIVVNNETGMLVAEADCDGMAMAMRRLLLDCHLAQLMGERARARALENFTLSGHIHAISEMIGAVKS